MKTAIIVLATLFIVGVSGLGSLESASVQPWDSDPLAFLDGHWRCSYENGLVMEEFWFPPYKGATTGVFRLIDPEGVVRMYELLAFTAQEDRTLGFALRHFGDDMQPRTTEVDGPFLGVVDEPTPGRLVIRCTERNADVETITYESTGKDTMRATLVFAANSGREPIVFEYDRAE